MQPTIGRIVVYTLGAVDVSLINRQRQARIAAGGSAGNSVYAGQQLPAIVVNAWPGSLCNIQVFLDGPDTYWATSRMQGDGENHWQWPLREGERVPGQSITDEAFNKPYHDMEDPLST